MYYNENFSRTEIIFGKDGMEKLKHANILVVGIGGVGGYVCEILARSSVEKLTIVDFDIIDKSNLNRQIIALNSTINKYKVDVMAKRILDINPNSKTKIFKEKINSENIHKIFSEKYDYVIDAIDDINAKILLIKYCKDNKINVISAMGAGNRKDIPKYIVADLYKTYNDPFAKKFRKIARDNNIKNLDVVFSPEIPYKTREIVGSTSYHPATCGIVIASFVINKILDK